MFTCEMTWPSQPVCEGAGRILVQLEDGDDLLVCLECALSISQERIGERV